MNEMFRRAQLETIVEVEAWAVDASMDDTLKLETALHFDFD